MTRSPYREKVPQPRRAKYLEATCAIPGCKMVAFPGWKYCCEDHAKAADTFRRVVKYRANHAIHRARWVMRNKRKSTPEAVKWAKRVLKGEPEIVKRPRYIHRSSKTYQILEDAGLHKHLPAEIQVID